MNEQQILFYRGEGQEQWTAMGIIDPHVGARRWIGKNVSFELMKNDDQIARLERGETIQVQYENGPVRMCLRTVSQPVLA